MPARVTRSNHKLGYREVLFNVNDDKFYTDADGDQYTQLPVTAVQ